MKKSKLIVPAALAVMLLSTAASVTGTVAWFTANRAVTIEANTFEVVSTDGSLAYRLLPGNCTVVSGSTGTGAAERGGAITMNTNCKLTDASVDLEGNTPVVYTDTPTDDGTAPSQFSAVASDYVVPSTDNKVWYCATWTIRFIYDFNGGASSVDLLFNCSGEANKTSTMSISDTTSTAASGSLKTGYGFRIGMYAGSEKVIFAGMQTLGNCNYIHNNNSTIAPKSNAAAGSYAAYTAVTDSSGELVTSSTALSLAGDGVSHSTRGDYLGTITKGTGTDATGNLGTLDLNCIAWFDGTDPNVVNNSDFNVMAATLRFYTRRGQ